MFKRSVNLKNSTWNLANILIYPVIFLAATPFFINKLGESSFGEWMLINSYVFISVHIAAFGLGHSLTAHVAHALGEKNDQKLYAYINSASGVFFFILLLAFIIGLFLLLNPLSIEYYFGLNGWKLIGMATLLIGIKFPEMLYQSIFKGHEAYEKAAIFNLANRLVSLGLHIYLVLNAYSLFEIIAASFLTNLIIVILQAVVIYRGYSNYSFSIFKNYPESKELYNFGFWTWLQTVIAVSAFQIDRFIVAYFLGTAVVTYYVLAATIANHLHMAFEAVVGWLLPKISRLKAEMKDTLDYYFVLPDPFQV